MREMPEAWGLVAKTSTVHNMPGQGHIFYPIMDYPEVDQSIFNPRVLPLVGAIFGGRENVRFQEFNIRVWPAGHGRGGMGIHHDAAVPNRYKRDVATGHLDCHSPPDYIQVFYYLTDVSSPGTPAFCVVPGSHRYPTLAEAHDALGEDYMELPVSGKAGKLMMSLGNGGVHYVSCAQQPVFCPI